MCACVKDSVNKHWVHKLFSRGEDIRKNNLKKPEKAVGPTHKCENELNCTQIQIHPNNQPDKIMEDSCLIVLVSRKDLLLG